ncbi:MAG: NADH-quinone oxidoreductase subunit L [Candidatus Heritagella sp.]
MEILIPLLILFPFAVAAVLVFLRKQKVRDIVMYTGSVLVMVLAGLVLFFWVQNGCTPIELFVNTHLVDSLMLVVEFFLMGLVAALCGRRHKYLIVLLSVMQTLLLAWVELFGPALPEMAHIRIDRLSILMCLIVAVIGGLICLYAVGYMRGYHHHHKEFRDRRPFFFAMLFVFLGAMFGLALSENLFWIDFFWEITSICSFLLIGYTQTEEAIHNSLRALWMNLLGGLGFAVAITYSSLSLSTVSLQAVVSQGAVIPVALLAFAALTKSAQFPFSQWLLGAMVAPTPTSALLHSATMVKAGVYMLLRLSPALNNTLTGQMVALIGGFTFFAASLLAISQSDGKKVLAYSTISNLGLITACAGVGMHETVWAAIFLLIFHAVSKSMLFQDVGAVENALGSRNIEDMQALMLRLPRLASIMVIGIAGMFLAPFGMLISKWAALKAFVDADNVLLVLLLAFGSATTMFYWTKWLGRILSISRVRMAHDVTKPNEWVSLYVHAVFMVLLCATFPLLSGWVVDPMLTEMFGVSVQVLSADNMLLMIIMLCCIFLLPACSYLFTRNLSHRYVISYMGGANAGDNNHFVDSLGEKKELQISNWYMTDLFGEKRLLHPCIIISAACLAVMMCIILVGGAV